MNKSWLVLILLVAGCAAVPPRMNESFALHPGETRQVGTDGFEITLRTAAEDSGCFSRTDCSTMLFSGTLAVRLGEKSTLMTIQSVLKPGQVLRLDIDGYEFHMTDCRRDASGRLAATFVVLGRGTGKQPD